jgi:hypothetical protein
VAASAVLYIICTAATSREFVAIWRVKVLGPVMSQRLEHGVHIRGRGSSLLTLPSMFLPMTESAQGDQVVLRIVTQLASFNEVMDLQPLGRAAFLASPPVASKYVLMKTIIFWKAELESRSFLANPIHVLARLSGGGGTVWACL